MEDNSKPFQYNDIPNQPKVGLVPILIGYAIIQNYRVPDTENSKGFATVQIVLVDGDVVPLFMGCITRQTALHQIIAKGAIPLRKHSSCTICASLALVRTTVLNPVRKLYSLGKSGITIRAISSTIIPSASFDTSLKARQYDIS